MHIWVYINKAGKDIFGTYLEGNIDYYYTYTKKKIVFSYKNYLIINFPNCLYCISTVCNFF